MKDALTGFVIFAMIVGAVFYGCTRTPIEQIHDHLDVEDDHFIEEWVEGYIEQETGLTIDLTPRSERTD